jgi:hypothetical protein
MTKSIENLTTELLQQVKQLRLENNAFKSAYKLQWQRINELESSKDNPSVQAFKDLFNYLNEGATISAESPGSARFDNNWLYGLKVIYPPKKQEPSTIQELMPVDPDKEWLGNLVVCGSSTGTYPLRVKHGLDSHHLTESSARAIYDAHQLIIKLARRLTVNVATKTDVNLLKSLPDWVKEELNGKGKEEEL